MKVTGPATPRSSSVRRSPRATGGKGGEFASALTSPSDAGSAGSAAPIDALNGLLAVQEVNDPADDKRRSMARADDLLDRLNDIRIGLLDGRIPVENLQRLLATLRDRGATVTDQGLKTVIEEIELRAAVELAKLGQLS